MKLPYTIKLKEPVTIDFGSSEFFNRDSLGYFDIRSITIPNYTLWINYPTSNRASIEMSGTWHRRYYTHEDAGISIDLTLSEIEKLNNIENISLFDILNLEWENYHVGY